MNKKTLVATALLTAAVVPGLALATSQSSSNTMNSSGSNMQTSQSMQKMSPVNINTADIKAFASVKGLSKKNAQAIIAYRTKNGGSFQSVDDLKNVPGINDKVFAKIKDQLTAG